MPKGMTDLERVMALIDKRKDGHWIWNGSRCGNRKQYGQVRLNGKKPTAHRAVWILLKGQITDGMDLLHQCPFTLCVNPDHLREGTHKENIDEALQARGNKGWQKRGEQHWNKKLTDKDVRDIRRRHKNGERAVDLAAEFKVKPPYISQITKGIWRKPV